MSLKINYVGTYLYTFLFCELVGTDEVGNKYYISKLRNRDGCYTRSVIYDGEVEPTSIPPMWHAWLSYVINDHPKSHRATRKGKSPIKRTSNTTGSPQAYQPSDTLPNASTKTFNNKSWNPAEAMKKGTA